MRRNPLFPDCARCSHAECCGGPQYGCVPDYGEDYSDCDSEDSE